MTNPHHPQFDCDLHARHEQNETERLRRRCAELEAYNATRTDELAAATKRIAELERHIDVLRVEKRNAVHAYEQKRDELVALRKRIEDAPVVDKEWVGPSMFDGHWVELIRKEDLTK